MQVDEGEKRGKAVILMNPVLKDIPSSAGIMGVRSSFFFLPFPSCRILLLHISSSTFFWSHASCAPNNHLPTMPVFGANRLCYVFVFGAQLLLATLALPHLNRTKDNNYN